MRQVFSSGLNWHPHLLPFHPHRLNEDVARILSVPRLVRSTANGLDASASISEDEANKLERHVALFPADAPAAATALEARATANQRRQAANAAAAAAVGEANAAAAAANAAQEAAAAAAEVPARIQRRTQRFQRLADRSPYPVVRRSVHLQDAPRLANEVQAVFANLRTSPPRGYGRGRGRGRRGRGN